MLLENLHIWYKNYCSSYEI